MCDFDQSESLAQCTQAISNSHTCFQMEKTLISGINLYLTHNDIFPLPEIDEAVSDLLIAWKKSVRLKSAALDPIQSQELENFFWVFLDHDSLREGILRRVIVGIITTPSTSLKRIPSKLFQTSIVSKNKCSSAYSMLQSIVSFK